MEQKQTKFTAEDMRKTAAEIRQRREFDTKNRYNELKDKIFTAAAETVRLAAERGEYKTIIDTDDYLTLVDASNMNLTDLLNTYLEDKFTELNFEVKTIDKNVEVSWE